MPTRLDVPVEGGSLAAFRLGAPGGGVEPVLAIHGITSSNASWVAVGRALGDRAALVAVDLRGRGESNVLPGPYGLEAHARDMLAVLDALGIDRARRRRALARRVHRGAAGRASTPTGYERWCWSTVASGSPAPREPTRRRSSTRSSARRWRGCGCASRAARSTASGGTRTRRSRAATSTTPTWLRTPTTT